MQDVYEFSPFLADKLAISVNNNQIDDVVIKIEQKFQQKFTTKSMIREVINYLLYCNDDRRNKYFLGLEQRIKSIFLYQQEYYNWYVSDETFNDSKPWDNILVDKKDKELMAEYGIAQGTWLNPEPFPWNEINIAIKLCSKWVFRKLTFSDAIELSYLLDEVLDTDLYYIFYGFTHASILDKETDDEATSGIFEIGVKNPIKRVGSQKAYDLAMKKICDKYRQIRLFA